MMKLLLDTHVLIWTLAQSTRLPRRIQAMISDPENLALVSAASAYEIEFKRPRSAELAGLPANLEEASLALGFTWLPIEPAHAVSAGRLARLHGDPFDRVIVAQALAENATVVSRDPLIGSYGVPTFW